MRLAAFLWKWLVCNVIHNKYKCKPTVWGPDTARKNNMPYRPNYWHCTKCHPCGEELDLILLNVSRTRTERKLVQVDHLIANWKRELDAK